MKVGLGGVAAAAGVLAVEHRLAHLDREEERQEVTDAETAAAGADGLTRVAAVAALGTDALNELEERRLRLMMG